MALRVYDIAKELGIDTKDALAKLEQLGEYVKSGSSTITPPVAKKLRDAFPGVKPKEEKPKAAPTATAPATPAAPAWASLALVAASSLPSWARSLYGTPQLPGQNFATDLSLKAIRKTIGVIPDAILAPPIFKAAMKRWDLVAAK
jgi:hypothetical protein